MVLPLLAQEDDFFGIVEEVPVAPRPVIGYLVHTGITTRKKCQNLQYLASREDSKSAARAVYLQTWEAKVETSKSETNPIKTQFLETGGLQNQYSSTQTIV